MPFTFPTVRVVNGIRRRAGLARGSVAGFTRQIHAARGVIIGRGVRWRLEPGAHVELVSVRDHDHDPSKPPSPGTTRADPVTIGRDCWIASKVTITGGVTVGDRTVVGANAVVTHDLGPGIVATGVPAKPT